MFVWASVRGEELSRRSVMAAAARSQQGDAKAEEGDY